MDSPLDCPKMVRNRSETNEGFTLPRVSCAFRIFKSGWRLIYWPFKVFAADYPQKPAPTWPGGARSPRNRLLYNLHVRGVRHKETDDVAPISATLRTRLKWKEARCGECRAADGSQLLDLEDASLAAVARV